LPGYVAGQYGFAECHIYLMRLARFAGARLIHDEAIGLDRARRQVLCRNHPPIRYDLVSLDIGSTPRPGDAPGAAAHTVSVVAIHRVGRVDTGRPIAADGAEVGFPEALLVTEAARTPWLAVTGLALDDRGFVIVDETYRSVADTAVLAAGEIATMPTHPRGKA